MGRTSGTITVMGLIFKLKMEKIKTTNGITKIGIVA